MSQFRQRAGCMQGDQRRTLGAPKSNTERLARASPSWLPWLRGRLPDQLHAQLDDAVAATELVAIQEATATGHVGVTRHQSIARVKHRQDRWDVQAEVSVVEGVVQFHSELDMRPLSDIGVFEYAHIPSIEAWRGYAVAPRSLGDRSSKEASAHEPCVGVNSQVSNNEVVTTRSIRCSAASGATSGNSSAAYATDRRADER